MDYIIGEITHDKDNYTVILVIYNQNKNDLSIMIRRVGSTTNIPINSSHIPVRLILTINIDDRIYYLLGSSMIEIKIKLTPNIGTIFTYSCDYPEKDSVKGSIWPLLADEIDILEDRSLCIGIGDNVYADNEWKRSLMYPNNTTNIYSERYRETLFGTERKRILKNSSNLFIPDDHEMVNDITFEQGMELVEHVATHIINVYENFLMQEHIDRIPFLNRDWVKYYDDLMIVTIERASKGIPDLNIILDRLNELLRNDINKIIIITGWACIPAPRSILYRSLFGTGKFMSDEDIYILYDYLLNISNRFSIVLVGGDLHFGSSSNVFRDDKQFDVLISSPITNKPGLDRKLASRSINDSRIFLKDIVFQNNISKAKRCYGKIDNNKTLSPYIVFKDD